MKTTTGPVRRDNLVIQYKGYPLRIACFNRPGNGQNIFYLHGLGSSKNDFALALRASGLNGCSLTAFDFPGCGNSRYPDSIRLEIDDLVEISNTIVRRLSAGKVILVGHSMGGVVALLLTERYPDTVRVLINVEGNLTTGDCFFSRTVAGYGPGAFTEKAFREFIQHLARSDKGGIREYARTLQKTADRNAYSDYSLSLVACCDNIDLLDKFIALKVPKLFIYGSQNRGLPYLPDLVKSKCPVREVPGSGHFPAFDNPRDYYAIIADFINSPC